MKKTILSLMLLSAGFAYGENLQKAQEKNAGQANISVGEWRGELGIDSEKSIPFNFSVKGGGGKPYYISLANGDEKLEIADSIRFDGDSIRLSMGVFDTELIAKPEGPDKLVGRWRRNDGRYYSMPFTAQKAAYRFKDTYENPLYDLSGVWESDFLNPNGTSEKMMGLLKQEENGRLTGTFLSITGDYRFLEGWAEGGNISLSCFDGTHAYLFEAKATDANNLAEGVFRSGNHYSQKWGAKRNENFTLPDANSLTYLKEGYEKLDFSFPNLEGKMVSPDEKPYRGKVRVVQIMGSWCPNCMDETAFLAPFYKQYKKKGLEVIGLAYELSPEFELAKKRVEKLKQRFDVGYTVLIAGTNDKKKVSESLPMLNAVVSFPTTIFIDKKGKVRKIHTGFSGPGTGEHYTAQIESFKLFVEKLLAE